MYSILCGILLVLSVMLAITCLLVHHKKQLQHLNNKVKQSQRIQYHQATQRKSHAANMDDGYVIPNPVAHPTLGRKTQPIFMSSMDPNKHYLSMDLKSESDNAYDSLENVVLRC